jgi:hypothetical protein
MMHVPTVFTMPDPETGRTPHEELDYNASYTNVELYDKLVQIVREAHHEMHGSVVGQHEGPHEDDLQNALDAKEATAETLFATMFQAMTKAVGLSYADFGDIAGKCLENWVPEIYCTPPAKRCCQSCKDSK